MENRKTRYPGCYRRGALERWKSEGGGKGFRRELDAWENNDWRAEEHGSIVWSGMGWSLENTWMETRRDGIGVIEVYDKGKVRGVLTFSGAESLDVG